VSGAIRRSHESKKRVRSATAFGQWNRNRLLRQSRVLFAHLTPGPLMGVDYLLIDVDWPPPAAPFLSAIGGPQPASAIRPAEKPTFRQLVETLHVP
jgi:hypothetical protein